MQTPTPHLEIRSLTKRFGAVDALADVDLTIARGEFVCLLGPSGCGKTTLLRIIAGFEKADRGQLLLEGKDITELAPHQRGFGMVFQSLALFPHMTVAENIGYGMKLRGAGAAQRRRRLEELLEVVQLPAIADRPVAALSGGQRQRVAIARALAVPPQLFLLDEPLSALDAQLRDSMQIELRQLQQRFGVTTVVVTHDQTEAMMLADRLVVMKQGRLQQCDTPRALYERPANVFVAGFIGSPAMNLCRVQCENGAIVLGGADIRLPNGARAGELIVGLRPESLELAADGIPCEVEVVEEIGADAYVFAAAAVGKLVARVDAKRAPERGARIILRPNGDEAHLFDPETGNRISR